MGAFDSASDRLRSKRILYFANLICFAKVLKNRVCVLSNSIALKSQIFSDRIEIGLNKEVLRNSKIADTILYFVC